MTPKEIFVQEMIKRGETLDYAEMRYEQIKTDQEKKEISKEERRKLAKSESEERIQRTAEIICMNINKDTSQHSRMLTQSEINSLRQNLKKSRQELRKLHQDDQKKMKK